MEKINFHRQERDLVDRLLSFFEAERCSRLPASQAGRVTEPASGRQIELLAKLGIYPKWQATRQEAYEMICHYKLILGSVNHRP